MHIWNYKKKMKRNIPRVMTCTLLMGDCTLLMGIMLSFNLDVWFGHPVDFPSVALLLCWMSISCIWALWGLMLITNRKGTMLAVLSAVYIGCFLHFVENSSSISLFKIITPMYLLTWTVSNLQPHKQVRSWYLLLLIMVTWLNTSM